MSPICPSNSTDCFLEALVEEDSGYNWNPLNFSFTAALSILGFVVASVALVQTLLAAGPGRLKASKSALGYIYGRKAKMRFDLTEFRFRTIARVPIIDLTKVAREQQPGTQDQQIVSSYIDLFIKHVNKFLPLIQAARKTSRSAAGWNLLLEDVNLEEFSFDTIECATDYLPGDIQAAPAFALLSDFIVLAMVAGCNNLQWNEGLIAATGPSLQLDMRTHVSLGQVLIYQHYGHTERRKFNNWQWGAIKSESLGELKYGGDWLSRGCLRNERTSISMNWGRLATTIDQRRIECDHVGCASREDVVSSWTTFFDWLDEDTPWAVDCSRLTALLFADKPMAAELFPNNIYDFRGLLTMIGNNNYRYLNPTMIEYELENLLVEGTLHIVEDASLTTEESNTYENVFRESSSWFTAVSAAQNDEGFVDERTHMNGRSPRSVLFQSRDGSPVTLKVDINDLVLSKEALLACFRWINNKKAIDETDSVAMLYTRRGLILQLGEVDLWLKLHGGDNALCSALNLIQKVRSDFLEKDVVRNQDIPGVQRPTFIKVNKKYLSPATLDFYGLPWEMDPSDSQYIIIKRNISHELQEELFEHTIGLTRKKLRVGGEESAPQHSHAGAVGEELDHNEGNPELVDMNLQERDGAGTPLTGVIASEEQEAVSLPRSDHIPSQQKSPQPLNPESNDTNKDFDPSCGNSVQYHAPTVEDAPESDSDNGNAQSKLSSGSSSWVLKGTSEVRSKPPSSHASFESFATHYSASQESEHATWDQYGSPMRAMQIILVFRAMLMATLFSGATDTSELLHLKSLDHRVQVL